MTNKMTFEEWKAAQIAEAEEWAKANAEAMKEPVNTAVRHGDEVEAMEGVDAETMGTVEAIVHQMAIEELDGGFWEASEHDQDAGEVCAMYNVVDSERWSGRKVVDTSECQTYREELDNNTGLLDWVVVDSTEVEREISGQLIAEKFDRHVTVQSKKRARFGLDGIVYDKAGRVRTRKVARTIMAQDKSAEADSRAEAKRRKEARKAARAEKEARFRAMLEANKAKLK